MFQPPKIKLDTSYLPEGGTKAQTYRSLKPRASIGDFASASTTKSSQVMSKDNKERHLLNLQKEKTLLQFSDLLSDGTRQWWVDLKKDEISRFCDTLQALDNAALQKLVSVISDQGSMTSSASMMKSGQESHNAGPASNKRLLLELQQEVAMLETSTNRCDTKGNRLLKLRKVQVSCLSDPLRLSSSEPSDLLPCTTKEGGSENPSTGKGDHLTVTK